MKFVFLRGGRAHIAEQLKNRRGHYFDPELLDSQFSDLEEPKSPDDAAVVELSGSPAKIFRQIVAILRKR